MQRMREQLSRMERRLNRLSHEVAEPDDDGTRPATADEPDDAPERSTQSTCVSRVNRDVERSLLRARNGVRYVRGSYRGKLGATPKDVVWEQDKAELWRYRNGPVRYGPPVLIVHSLVSRSYILDLRPGSSLVEYLTGSGIDVFLLDWGVPDELDAENDLERYVDGYVPRAIAAVQRETGSDEVTLAGYCLGGVLAAIYAAGHEDAPVRNLILMATPVDFDEMGAMVALLREGRLEHRGPRRRHRQRAGRRPLQRLLHAGADRRGRAEGDVAGEPLERRVRRGISGDGGVVARPRPVPGSRCSASSSTSSSARTSLMTGSIRARRPRGAPRRRARQRAQRHGGRRQRRPACGRRADHADRGRPRAARGAATAWGPRHVRHRPQRGQAHDAAPRGVDHRRTQTNAPNPRSRDGVPTDRARRRAGAQRASSRASPTPTAPSSRRTSTTRRWSPPGRVPGTARVIAVDAGEVVGSVAVVPLHGWSSHVGEVRLVVDPEHRGRGIGRGLARQAVVEAWTSGSRS